MARALVGRRRNNFLLRHRKRTNKNSVHACDYGGGHRCRGWNGGRGGGVEGERKFSFARSSEVGREEAGGWGGGEEKRKKRNEREGKKCEKSRNSVGPPLPSNPDANRVSSYMSKRQNVETSTCVV